MIESISDIDIEFPCERPPTSETRLSKYDVVKKFEMLQLLVISQAGLGKISIYPTGCRKHANYVNKSQSHELVSLGI